MRIRIVMVPGRGHEMFVGVLTISFHLSGVSSLKEKRRIVRSAVDRTRSKFNAAVAEVSENDSLRSAVIGVCVVGNESAFVSSMLSQVGKFVEWLGLAPVGNVHTEVIPLGSHRFRDENRPFSFEETAPARVDGIGSAFPSKELQERERFGGDGVNEEEEEW